MAYWEQVVAVLREAIFAYTLTGHGRNIGAGIAIVTLLARLALLPLAVKLARAMAAHQAAVQRIRPELDAIRTRFKSDPGGSPKKRGACFSVKASRSCPVRAFWER